MQEQDESIQGLENSIDILRILRKRLRRTILIYFIVAGMLIVKGFDNYEVLISEYKSVYLYLESYSSYNPYQEPCSLAYLNSEEVSSTYFCYEGYCNGKMILIEDVPELKNAIDRVRFIASTADTLVIGIVTISSKIWRILAWVLQPALLIVILFTVIQIRKLFREVIKVYPNSVKIQNEINSLLFQRVSTSINWRWHLIVSILALVLILLNILSSNIFSAAKYSGFYETRVIVTETGELHIPVDWATNIVYSTGERSDNVETINDSIIISILLIISIAGVLYSLPLSRRSSKQIERK